MKTKLLSTLSALLLMAMTSCNGNGGTNVVDGGHGIGIDTATVNAINRAEEACDDIDVAPEDQWTEEAVAHQVRKYFDAVNATFADDSDLDCYALDRKFYTKYWNEVYAKVLDKDNQQPSVEKCFFVDDFHWTFGLETPLEVKNLKAELLTGNMAEATFTLVEKQGGFSRDVVLSLDYEADQWLINNWREPDQSVSQSILCEMEEYVR